MKKSAWIPVLTLAGNLVSGAEAYAKQFDCSSKDGSVNLSFYEPSYMEGRNGANGQYYISMANNALDKKEPYRFQELKVSASYEGLYISPDSFEVELYYYYSPDDRAPILKTIGLLQGKKNAAGAWILKYADLSENTASKLTCKK